MLRIAETFFQGCFAYLIISLIVGPRTLMRFIYYVTAAEDWHAPSRDFDPDTAGLGLTIITAIATIVYVAVLFFLGSLAKLQDGASETLFGIKVGLYGPERIVSRILDDAGTNDQRGSRKRRGGGLASSVAHAAGVPVSQVILIGVGEIDEEFTCRSLISRTRVFDREVLIFDDADGPLRVEMQRSLDEVRALAAREVVRPGGRDFSSALERVHALRDLLPEEDEALLGIEQRP